MGLSIAHPFGRRVGIFAVLSVILLVVMLVTFPTAAAARQGAAKAATDITPILFARDVVLKPAPTHEHSTSYLFL
jgi:hypothetical protein